MICEHSALLKAESRGIEVLALEEAPGAITRIDARKGRVVELRELTGNPRTYANRKNGV
jgi:hypothetical protein